MDDGTPETLVLLMEDLGQLISKPLRQPTEWWDRHNRIRAVIQKGQEARDRERNLLPEVIKTLRTLTDKVANGSIKAVGDFLLGLRIASPRDCSCIGLPSSSLDAWIHENHAVFNKAVWEILLSDPPMISGIYTLFDQELDKARSGIKLEEKQRRRKMIDLKENLLVEKNPPWCVEPAKTVRSPTTLF